MELDSGESQADMAGLPSQGESEIEKRVLRWNCGEGRHLERSANSTGNQQPFCYYKENQETVEAVLQKYRSQRSKFAERDRERE